MVLAYHRSPKGNQLRSDMPARAVHFTAPRQVELVTVELPDRARSELLVRTA